MSFLRSRELAFWLAVVTLLAGVMVFAATRGAEPVPGGRSTLPVGAPAAERSQAVTQVRNLQALMPAGIAAGTQPAAVVGFADAVTEQARQGASIRAGEGADAQDPLLRTFTRVGSDATRLRTTAAGPANPVAVTALRTQVGLGVAQLHLLAMGQPAPDLPAAGLDPLGAGSRPSAPTAATPQQPALERPDTVDTARPAPSPRLPHGLGAPLPRPAIPTVPLTPRS